ncbi:FtsK/SpoIIIE domain-containing protein [Arthrobacter sp. CJ23]|uniref:FtsK/SpoIIIE domain-containing protein n=1 Tax=Arthrobacter sp. CJ23 TaxID=2972479 RepID=UPI00215C12CE|nr:FtsK/SpoIIIE domain-containing protein [Arthrobacter sp. CJ23]UVJ38320.1 FtsK/SpoIIIE domain-containing protein [Arthrobacter sp. CJ23]
MTLHCSLVRGPFAALRAEPEELSIEVADGAPGSQVESAVMQTFSTGELSVAGTPLSVLEVGRAPLVNGAVLLDGGPSPAVPATAAIRRPPLRLVVHTGPGAGTVVPLERGTYRIGRRDAAVSIPDPGISRNHAELHVTDTAITVTDNKSANGTSVDGQKIRSCRVSTASEIRCGSSRMAIQLADDPGGTSDLTEAGRSVAEPLIVPRSHDGSNRSQLLLTAGLPLVLGVGMALITGIWMFLAFTAASAVAVLAPAMSGRGHRRAFRKAVRTAADRDEDRRRRCSPSAAVLAVEASRQPAKRPAATETTGAWLRVGTCLQKSNISVQPADPDFGPPERVMPLALDPTNRVITLSGSDRKVQGMLRSFLMQLASFPICAGLPVLLLGPAELLPLAARFLPGALLCSDPAEAIHALAASSETPGWLFLVGDAAAGTGADDPRRVAEESGWHVVLAQPPNTNASDTVVDLGGRQAALHTGGSTTEFDADLVPADVFDRFCRSVAAASKAPSATSGIPDGCGLGELLPHDPVSIAARWADGQSASGLFAVVGRGASGPTILDLQTDGPHLLVAGTTGSGKSEFLRTLVTSLSLSHAPDRVNFLFVDFKGGSGLGPFIGLPHCVGLLTDLNQHALDRTLMSLRAEVRRREELLARAKTQDLTAYRQLASPSLPTLPHLLVVVDEFRMLVEEAPAALAELMRVAAIGRSLGIHLVMATQRPQGALNADIRANVTTSIALRVQSDMESLDVINSRDAAAIPVSLPGRAFMARGSAPPELFQTASLTSPLDGSSHAAVIARTAIGVVRAGRAGQRTAISRPMSTPAQAATPIVEATRRLWTELGGEAPRRPVAAPLPATLTMGSKDLQIPPPGRRAAEGKAVAATTVCLGLVDVPADQQVVRLLWRPSTDGHLGLIGPGASGVSEAVLATASVLATAPVDAHLYILDGDSSFSGAFAVNRVGAAAGVHEARRAARILERLTDEMASRQARPEREARVPLVLVVCNWGAWISAFRSGPATEAEDLLMGIVRDGSRAGITVVISGDRELVASRLFAALPNRAFFPTGSTEESRLAWPRFGAMDNVAGRALAAGNFLDGNTAVAQFAAPPPDIPWPYSEAAPASRPFRVEPLPDFTSVGDVLARAPHAASGRAVSPDIDAAAAGRYAVLLGIGGDELEVASVRLAAGSVFLALGSPGSGKSGLMRVLPALNPGHRWIAPGPKDTPERFWTSFRQRASSAVRETASYELDGGGSDGWIQGRGPHRGSILLVDDAEQLTASAAAQLSALNEMGFTMVATASMNTPLLHRSPLCLSARNHGHGLLIGPRNPTDGDFFGLRIDSEPSRAPGRAVLIQDGSMHSIQIAAPGTDGPGTEVPRTGVLSAEQPRTQTHGPENRVREPEQTRRSARQMR